MGCLSKGLAVIFILTFLTLSPIIVKPTNAQNVGSLSVYPSSGPPGTTVQISGGGFTSNYAVTIEFDGAFVATEYVGDFTMISSAQYTIPSSKPAGTYYFTATDDAGDSARATFTVTTALGASPTPVPTPTQYILPTNTPGMTATPTTPSPTDSPISTPTNAQKPSIPLFSVSTSNSTSTIPTTYTTDPYTGTNVTNIGYTVASFTVAITIQNNPKATAYILGVKGHYSSQWQVPWVDQYNVTALTSSGSQTVITLQGDNNTSGQANQIFLQYGDNWGINVPFGGQLDFRLQAVSGTPVRALIGYNVLGSVSDWSDVQTVAVPDFSTTTASPTPYLTPTPTSSVPEFPALALLPLLLSVFSVAIAFKLKKTSY
jgi:hypothetical protein